MLEVDFKAYLPGREQCTCVKSHVSIPINVNFSDNGSILVSKVILSSLALSGGRGK